MHLKLLRTIYVTKPGETVLENQKRTEKGTKVHIFKIYIVPATYVNLSTKAQILKLDRIPTLRFYI